jgi:dsRNA-specific ribonuclease
MQFVNCVVFQLLRSSLVNNRTQAVVCDDLGMISYALYSNPKVELKTKDRADLLEAFLGALYVDKVCVCAVKYKLLILEQLLSCHVSCSLVQYIVDVHN